MRLERAPHVLYVAWGFPPARGGGVYRALATVNAFACRGFRVTVLTADRAALRRYTGLDTSLEARIDPRVRVRRVPFSWPARDSELRRWGVWRALFPRVWWRARKGLDLLAFPEYGYGPWRRPLESAAQQVHEHDPVDLVVASANPNVDFMAADVLARRGVPYLLDYRDAWMLDVFGGGLLHPQGGGWTASSGACSQVRLRCGSSTTRSGTGTARVIQGSPTGCRWWPTGTTRSTRPRRASIRPHRVGR